MSFRTALSLLAMSVSLGGFLLAHGHGSAPRTDAGPIYNYVCVGGKAISGPALPEACFYDPIGTAPPV